MKAAQIVEYVGKDAVKITATALKPKPKTGQVLVEVYAASVNPFDIKIREGIMKDFIPLKLPATLGGDVAGIVSEIGEGVNGFKIGDEVYGQANAAGGEGSFAEFTPVVAKQLALKPKSIDFITAAATPLAAASAYQALVEHINLQKAQKILIHGGGGGIGSFAIQLAKHIGAYVATTVSGQDAEFVKRLGADEVINYKTQHFEEVLKSYDAVFDTVGGKTYEKSFKVLKDGGTIVSMVRGTAKELAEPKNIKAIQQGTNTQTEKLKKIAELIDQGVLKVNVDKVFPFKEAAEALEYLKEGHPKGKVVLKIK